MPLKKINDFRHSIQAEPAAIVLTKVEPSPNGGDPDVGWWKKLH